MTGFTGFGEYVCITLAAFVLGLACGWAIARMDDDWPEEPGP